MPEAQLASPIDTSDPGEDTPEARLAEPIRRGLLDLGDVICQEIAAALDPYPRLADAALERSEAAPADPDASHPFAKLRELGKSGKPGSGSRY